VKPDHFCVPAGTGRGSEIVRAMLSQRAAAHHEHTRHRIQHSQRRPSVMCHTTNSRRAAPEGGPSAMQNLAFALTTGPRLSAMLWQYMIWPNRYERLLGVAVDRD
jgi:hypothetical protein